MTENTRVLPGWLADHLGSIKLVEIATQVAAPILVEGPSRHHAASVYNPQPAPATLAPGPHEFAFDLKLWATVRVTADSERVARSAICAELGCMDVGFDHTTPEGVRLVITEASPDNDEGFDLIEIDGEAV